MANTAVITGGGSGLGEACARKLATTGAETWILDMNAEAADSVAESIVVSCDKCTRVNRRLTFVCVVARQGDDARAVHRDTTGIRASAGVEQRCHFRR